MKKRLMCVVAHPDDECVAFGGALAIAVTEGAEVYIVCLTDGQAATFRGHATTPAELGAIRRKEFAASCEVLGATKYEVLDYQDGKLEFENAATIGAQLTERMRLWKPHVVVTFGLDGSLNTHADHAVVSAFTSMAFQWCARSRRFPEQLERGLELWTPQKLYHQTTSYKLPGREQLSPAPWTLALDISPVTAIKIKAFRQHATQQPIMEKVSHVWEQHNHIEHYTLAATTTPRGAVHETSMFEGL